MRSRIKALAAIDILTEYALENVRRLKKSGSKYCFMPLHGGTDDFMSVEDYRRFYWPSLQRVIQEIIDCGMVPYVFCEGKYDTRLEVLREVPQGKVIYMFEQVDIARASRSWGTRPVSAAICRPRCSSTASPMRWWMRPAACWTPAPRGRLRDGLLHRCWTTIRRRIWTPWFDTTLQYGKY